MTNAAAWRLVFRISTLLALIAGLLLFAGATRSDDYFSWTIEPAQTAAFLGAAYWAAAVLFAWASLQEEWSRIRVAALPEVTVGALLLLATLLALDKFHHDLFGYFWISAYVLAVPLLGYLVASSVRGAAGSDRDSSSSGSEPETEAGGRRRRQSIPVWLRALLGLQAIAFTAYGIGLFVSPSAFDGAWPWAVTPLTARAIAAFLLGFAVAAAMAVRTGELEHFRGAAYTYAVLGGLQILAAALHSSDFRDGASLPLFVGFFATTLVAGVAAVLLDRAQSPLPARDQSSLLDRDGPSSSSRSAASGS